MDAPRDKKFPAGDEAWLLPKVEELTHDPPTAARAMFRRECVLYCSILKGFVGVFKCKNESCSSAKEEPFFMVQLKSGFGNLDRHAATCYGEEEYDKKLEEARDVVGKGVTAQRLFFTTFFNVVRQFNLLFSLFPFSILTYFPYEKGVPVLLRHLIINNYSNNA